MGYRLIDVNGKEYGFIIGNTVLKVKGPEGEGSKTAPLHEVLGITKEVWTDALASRCSDGNCHACLPEYMTITPRKVAVWIDNNFPKGVVP